MRKIGLLTSALLALLCLVSGASAIARAQNPPPAPPGQEPGQTQAGPGKTWNRDADLNDPKLNLSDDQKTQIKKLRENQHAQLQALRNDSSLSEDQKREKFRQVRQDTTKQIEALLTPDQRKVWAEKQKEWRQEGHEGHGGHGHDEGAPPPPQQ
jgi:periplasmic protein CpxP/Spy